MNFVRLPLPSKGSDLPVRLNQPPNIGLQPRRTLLLSTPALAVLAALWSLLPPAVLLAQTPAQQPATKATAAKPSPTAPNSATIQGPVSKHYPILVIAHGAT